jgi:hypothetical protein
MGGCEFDLAASLTVIDKGFKKSVGDGFLAIKQETTNVITRGREILAPTAASFVQLYEVVNGRLHWLGDKLSVEHHLRRYPVWLKAHDAPEEQINQSKLDRDVWSVVEPGVLKLGNGQALFWLAMRTADAAKGVALQQIKKENGLLIQNSQLLPFDKLAEIEGFLDLLTEGREDASINVGEDSGLSTIGGWIVEGASIDFGKDLPGLIDQAIQPLSNLIPVEVLPQIQFLVTTITSFWFEVAAAAAAVSDIVEAPMPLFVTNEITSDEMPTRSNLVGISQTVDLGVGNPVIIFEAQIVKPTVINLEPEEKFKQLAITKQHLYNTVVKAKCCFPEAFPVEIPTRIVFAGHEAEAAEKPSEKTDSLLDDRAEKCQEPMMTSEINLPLTEVFEEVGAEQLVEKVKASEKPTRSNLVGFVGFEGEKPKVLRKIIYQVSKQQGKVEKAIPIYQQHWQAAAIKDIPEWVWQGTAADPNEIIDWPWFLVTMFYALLNTKVLLNGKIS